jgi:hypothetical protein
VFAEAEEEENEARGGFLQSSSYIYKYILTNLALLSFKPREALSLDGGGSGGSSRLADGYMAYCLLC